MPEGDTLARSAAVLSRWLVGGLVVSARARRGPLLRRVPDLSVLAGSQVSAVESRGKHLLITFDGTRGRLTLRTHLRMTGAWHRYRPGEAWRLPERRASVEIVTERVVAVCFDCPTVELLTDSGLARSRPLRELGPDLVVAEADLEASVARLAARPETPVGEALLDQTMVAGIGNVVRNEALFMERVDPWASVGSLDSATLRRLVARSAGILRAAAANGRRVTTGNPHRGEALWVYRRAGRPCRRCGTLIRAARQGPLARSTYWCPRCQPDRPAPA